MAHPPLTEHTSKKAACGSKNTHLPRNWTEVVGEKSRDFMSWGYKLEGKDGARGLEGDPTAMLTCPRCTAIA